MIKAPSPRMIKWDLVDGVKIISGWQNITKITVMTVRTANGNEWWKMKWSDRAWWGMTDVMAWWSALTHWSMVRSMERGTEFGTEVQSEYGTWQWCKINNYSSPPNWNIKHLFYRWVQICLIMCQYLKCPSNSLAMIRIKLLVLFCIFSKEFYNPVNHFHGIQKFNPVIFIILGCNNLALLKIVVLD